MAKLPSNKQLEYLKRLGYNGIKPITSKQASVAIDAMLELKDTKSAEKAIAKQLRVEEKQAKQDRKDRLRGIKEEIRFMTKENRAFGGEGLYAGFIFIELEDEQTSLEDLSYLGAFMPLEVAQKYPELLVRETLDFEEVLSDDKLPRGISVVVSPGRFKTLKSKSSCLSYLLATIAALAIIYALIMYTSN